MFFCIVGLSACGDGGNSADTAAESATMASDAGAVPAPATPDNNAAFFRCPTASAYSEAAPPPALAGTVSGRVSFDRVPFSDQLGAGLDYADQASQPARGVIVEAQASSDGLSCDGAVVATTVTDGDGWYRLSPPAGIANVCVRARAQLYRAADSLSAASWNIAVADNTAGNALYTLAEISPASIAEHPRRDLHAASGWSGGSYTGTRAAAPFAILDTACKTLDAVLAQRNSTQFGALTFFWSTKNTSDDNGSLQQGKIGGAFFDSSTSAIYLRGDAAVNTDEFDEMVIAHEFGHFVTHVLSRSDTLGGYHSLLDYEDPRLAFDEGWATAFAGLALNDPIYRDSDEVATASSPELEFHFDIRQRFDSSVVPVGWYSESSMQRLLYTLGADTASGGSGLGLGALLATFSGGYKRSDALASIFSYGTQLLNDQPAYASAIVSALDLEQINGAAITAFAADEQHAPSSSDLPVYTTLAADAGAQSVCSSNIYGTENALSDRRYLRFEPPHTGRYQFSVKPVSGGVAGFELLDRGTAVVSVDESTAGETLQVTSGTLEAGRSYVLSVFHVGNVVADTAVAAGDQCFQVWTRTL